MKFLVFAFITGLIVYVALLLLRLNGERKETPYSNKEQVNYTENEDERDAIKKRIKTLKKRTELMKKK